MSGHPHKGKRSEWHGAAVDVPFSGDYEVRAEGAGDEIVVAHAYRMLCRVSSRGGLQTYLRTVWRIPSFHGIVYQDLYDLPYLYPDFQWRGLAEKPE